MKKVKKSPQSTSPRVAQKRRSTREDILNAARDIMLETGADAVSLASVSARLGLTKQALYHYFSSREALSRELITRLLDEEVKVLIAAVNDCESDENVLGVLIHAFYNHYRQNLEAFKTIYCQPQLYPVESRVLNETVLKEEINPRTRGLFDVLEERLVSRPNKNKNRAEVRRLAFSAWLSALGLLNMLSVADSVDDPLIYSDDELLATLSSVFDQAAIHH